jgi:hypothetical protein
LNKQNVSTENQNHSDTILTNKGVSIFVNCVKHGEKLIGCNAFINGEDVADVSFRNSDGWYSMNSVTNKSKQRLGIMTAIYNYVESKFNIKINPSKEQSPNAINFWKNRT